MWRRGTPRPCATLATGAGKTYIAVNLLKRIADAGQLRRALFICDRDARRSYCCLSECVCRCRHGDQQNAQKNAVWVIATYKRWAFDAPDSDATANETIIATAGHIGDRRCHRSA